MAQRRLLSHCFNSILLTPFHGKLYVGHHRCQWLHPILSVKTFLCSVTARLIICRFSIRLEQNPLILLRLSLTPSLQEFEARHSHSIPESYSEYHRQGQPFRIPRILLRIPQTRLDFPDPHKCRHPSSLYHEDSVGESKRYTFKLCCRQNGSGCQSRAFISENDNEGYLSSHSSCSWVRMNILE